METTITYTDIGLPPDVTVQGDNDPEAVARKYLAVIEVLRKASLLAEEELQESLEKAIKIRKEDKD